MPNCEEILEVLGKLFLEKMLRKFHVVGYFSLYGFTCAMGSYMNSVEKGYINEYRKFRVFAMYK